MSVYPEEGFFRGCDYVLYQLKDIINNSKSQNEFKAKVILLVHKVETENAVLYDSAANEVYRSYCHEN